MSLPIDPALAIGATPPNDPTLPGAGNTATQQNQAGVSGENAGQALATKRVVVNLHANISVSGDVDIISSSGEQLYDVVVCAVDVNASSLYADASSGIIEFWEISGTAGAINACISAADAHESNTPTLQARGFTPEFATNLTTDLNAVITGGQDAQAANPFKNYVGLTEYNYFATLGDPVLGLYAHYLLGPVAATAAIDNDAALVAYMNSNDAGGAEIPTNLVAALKAITPSVAKAIAGQVLSQDPGRASGVDNNQHGLYNGHQALLFAAGDVVYFQVTVEAPTVSVGGNPANVASPGSDALNKPTSSTLPSQSTGNTTIADGAPKAGGSTTPGTNTNLEKAQYPAVAPTFALQIRLVA